MSLTRVIYAPALALSLLLPAAGSASADLTQLAWLAGHWTRQDGARWSEEHWLPPRDGLMLGVNRAGNGSGKTSFEFLRIAPDTDGTPVYWASPGGASAVSFRLESAEGTQASFVNPEHDYPQRIRYVRDGDRLTATISLLDGSQGMRFEWRLAGGSAGSGSE